MPFLYNVAGLLKEPVGATREYAVDSTLLLQEGDERAKHIAGEARLMRTPRGALVTATISGAILDDCSRCLKPLSQPIELRIEEEFVQTVDIDTGARLGKGEDPDDFRIDSHHMLDIEDAVRQYWSAALPMRVLCRPTCRGLCSRCGANLNDGTHECTAEEDERWSALRALAAKRERT